MYILGMHKPAGFFFLAVACCMAAFPSSLLGSFHTGRCSVPECSCEMRSPALPDGRAAGGLLSPR